MRASSADGLLRRHRRQILVLGNGAAGAEKQALALATKLQAFLPAEENVSVAMCRIPYASSFFAQLPPVLHGLLARSTHNPWLGYAPPHPSTIPSSVPDIVIGCGRTTVALCAGFKQAFPRLFNIQIQHPRIALHQFDAVVAPQHDFQTSPPPPNVYLTPGTVCHLSTTELVEAKAQWQHRASSWAHLPGPKIALLVGGSCRGYTLTVDRARHLVNQLASVLRTLDTPSLLVTFSRRTPPSVAAFLAAELPRACPSVYIWDGADDNPFLGFLAHAAAVVTTPDSISMTTEAIASGKPTFVLDMHLCTGKFRAFHRELDTAHLAAPLDALTAASINLEAVMSIESRQAEMDGPLVSTLGAAIEAHWHARVVQPRTP
ncbi:Aste57867_23350 [Aphanomyces stellatus]|uniref:Aste57867_23350 protein n=1 Tax=Aphanomyces stellatus TaxID=120398 RepID=A0A485LS27_9STRA|nr:hypothetical protein As57867_023279 [Aphanomyces stellatus]VFT99995.1 Aste57867_23350 [Aphanomyces stellatus]